MTAVAVVIIAALVLVFRLGNQASAGVSLDDPVIWVEHGLRGELLQVNGATQEITARVAVGEPGDDLVAIPRDRDAVFLNRTTGEVGVVGAVSLRVDNADELRLGNGQLLTGASLDLRADLDASTDAYVVGPNSVVTIEPGAGIRRTTAISALGDMAVDRDGRLVAVTESGQQLVRSDPNGLVLLADLEDPIDEAPSLLRSGSDLFVVDPGRRTVQSITPDGSVASTTCVAGSLADVIVGGSPSSSDTPRVVIHDPAAGVVSVSDPAAADCFPIEADVPGEAFGPAVAVGNFAYLPNYSLGRIEVLDLAERALVESIAFSRLDQPFELEVFDNAVWANEPQGRRAAIIRGREIERISKVSQGLVSEAAEGNGDVAVAGEAETDDRVFGNEGDLVGGGQGDEDQVGGGEAGAGPDEGLGLNGAGAGADGDEPVVEDPLPGAPPLVVDVIDATATPPPEDELVANFEFTSSQVNVGQNVTFTDTSTGAPTSWNWDFGDGTGADGPEVTTSWDVEGLYTVTLFVTDARGRESSQALDVTVLAVDVLTEPTAFFGFRSGTIEVGETIVFTDQSTGEPETLLWDLGDGTQASGTVVEHQYDQAGIFEIELTASNAAGSDSTRATVTVVDRVAPPEAIIGTFPRVVQTGQSVTFTSESTNSPTSTTWDFDDGETGLGAEVRHAWEEPGTYRVRLLVSNSAGTDEIFADIVVEPSVIPPEARFSESTLEAIVGETVNFTSLSLNNPTSVSWEFGDNSTAAGPNVSHAWDTPGTYRVTLTVANDAGTDDLSKTVTISPPPPDPPVAAFTIADATVPVNAVVDFTDASTNAPASWLWDFDDGATSSAQSPPHAFSTPGTYEVTLTVTNVSGSDSVTRTIIVIDPPLAAFSTSVDELAVSFADGSTNGPTSWSWDFGDGTTSTAQNPSKSYTNPGTYTVVLIASNAAGSSAPVSQTIEVAAAPNAAFTSATSGLTAQFGDTSTNAPDTWSWDFGDGTTSAAQNPQHTYDLGGTYTVVLTVSNAGGTDTFSDDVTVMVAPPVADFSCQVLMAGVACDGSTSTAAVSYLWSATPAPVVASGLNTPNPIFTFGTSGSYDISLTVENTAGVTDTDTQTFVVTVPMAPEISVISVVSNTNGVVELQGTASENPTSWAWTATGGAITNATTDNPTITYASAGTYTATATATNGVGTSPAESVTFTVVISAPPTVTSVSETANSGGVVALSAAATESPTSYTWSIPGGTVVAGAATSSPSFSFGANGSYNGTVTATNADGTSAPFPFTVTVADAPPVVTAVADVASGPGVVGLTGTATNSPTTWTWSIPGGTVIAGAGTSNPTVQFGSNGTFTGTATATNAGGTSAAFSFSVTVASVPPTAAFTWAELPPSGRVQFTDSSTALAGASYVWNFGGGTQTAGSPESPRVTFPGPGTYTVTLTITDSAGTDSFTDSVIVVD